MHSYRIAKSVCGQARDLAALDRHYAAQANIKHEGDDTLPTCARAGSIELRCGDVASAVFIHNNDRNKRDKLALSLVALAETIVAQGIEARQGGNGEAGAVHDSAAREAGLPETPHQRTASERNEDHRND